MTSTNQEIMRATYRVLVKRGYADLTVRQIPNEFDGSMSLLYYHYENKEDLLAGFLQFLIAEFERELDQVDEPCPGEFLREIVDIMLPSAEDAEHLSFQQTLLEIRAQTPHHSQYRELFEEIDDRMQSELQSTIQRGLDEGTFAGVTPEEGADTLLLLMYGVTDRYVPMRDWDGIDRGREYIYAEIDCWEANPC